MFVLSLASLCTTAYSARLTHLHVCNGRCAWFVISRLYRLEDDALFELNVWENRPLPPAPVRPFREWFESFVGRWEQHKRASSCFNMVWKSTRTRLLQRPRAFYERLSALVNAHSNNEAIHFVERSVAVIFGGHSGSDSSEPLDEEDEEVED